MAIEVRWGSVTHVGCVRTANQDAVLAGPVVFAVADGMGGHAAGEVASAIAIAQMATLGAGPTGDVVLGAVRAANAEVISQAPPGSGREGMGTTLSGMALVSVDGRDSVLVFNVGDSRTYVLDASGMGQITSDHSLVAEMIRDGELDPDDAAVHLSRNVVTRALGISPEVQVDHWWIEPRVGQTFFMCSDGLTNEVPVEDVEAVLQAEPSPQRAVDILLERALDAGARDNVSAIAVVIDAVTLDASVIEEDTNPRANVDAAGAGAVIDSVPGTTPDRGAADPPGPVLPLVTGVPSTFEADQQLVLGT